MSEEKKWDNQVNILLSSSVLPMAIVNGHEEVTSVVVVDSIAMKYEDTYGLPGKITISETHANGDVFVGEYVFNKILPTED